MSKEIKDPVTRSFNTEDKKLLTQAQLNDLCICEEDDDDDFKLANWVIGELKFGEETYTMIHGFPGDNVLGLIFNKQQSYIVGRPTEKTDTSLPEQWYAEITENCCTYERPFWYEYLF